MPFYLKLHTKSGDVIVSPPIAPLHPLMDEGNGRILMLIKKTGEEIVANDQEISSWSASWKYNAID